MTKVNGNLLYNLKSYIISNYGDDFFHSAINELDEAGKEIMNKPILSSEMYDVRIMQNLMDIFRKKTSQEEELKFPRYHAQKQLSGFFGFVVNMISLDMLIGAMSRMWKKTFTDGKIELIERRKNDFIKVLISEFEFNEAHQFDMEIYIKTLIEIATKKTYTSHSKAIDNLTTEFVYLLQN